MSLFIPLLQGFLLSLSLCLDLGVVNTAIMKTGIDQGVKRSFAVGFGSCFGDLLYLCLALLGVGVIFELFAVKLGFWLIGTATLLFLSFKMIRETVRPKRFSPDRAPSVKQSLLRCWLTGAGLAMASPTSIAWFALVAGPIVAGMQIGSGPGLAAFVAGFFAAGLLWSFSVALISGLSGSWAGPRLARALSLCSALLFLYFAVKLFWDGWQQVIIGGGVPGE